MPKRLIIERFYATTIELNWNEETISKLNLIPQDIMALNAGLKIWMWEKSAILFLEGESE